MTSHDIWYILFFGSKSLGPAHNWREGSIQGHKYWEMGMTGNHVKNCLPQKFPINPRKYQSHLPKAWHMSIWEIHSLFNKHLMSVRYGKSTVLHGRWTNAEVNKIPCPQRAYIRTERERQKTRYVICWTELTAMEKTKQGRGEGYGLRYTACRKGLQEKVIFEKNHERDQGTSHLAIWEKSTPEAVGTKVLRQEYKPVGTGWPKWKRTRE